MDDTPLRQPRLTTALRALAADEAKAGASAGVQCRLLDEVRRLRHVRRRSSMKISVAAATLFAVTATLNWQLATSDLRRPTAEGITANARAEMVTAFYPLPYSIVPMNGGRLVRLEVPRETMAEFGIADAASADGSAAGLVLADVLVGDDGLARAIRFVRPATGDVEKEQGR